MFSFGEPPKSRETPVEASPAIRREAPRPEWIEENAESVHCIQWRWYSPGLFGQLLFCVLWDGFLVVWYYLAFNNAGGVQWMMVVFPTLHVAVGLQLTYATLAGFLNRTTVTFDGMTLKITHWPCPWPGQALEAATIEQIYCVRQRSSVDVYGILGGNRRVRLLGVQDQGHAIFLEDQIEGWLGLPDEIVPGELRDCGQPVSDTNRERR